MSFTAPDHELTDEIIRYAIEVHRVIGPGLKEEIYEAALEWELKQAGHEVRRQVPCPVTYKGVKLLTCREDKKIDMLIDSKVIVELKATPVMEPVFKAQCLTYVKMLGLKSGLVLNFGRVTLRDGLARVTNESAEEYRTRLLHEDPAGFRRLLIEENGVAPEVAERMQRECDLGLGAASQFPIDRKSMDCCFERSRIMRSPSTRTPASCLDPSCKKPAAARTSEFRDDAENVYSYLTEQNGWLPKDYHFDRDEAEKR